MSVSHISYKAFYKQLTFKNIHITLLLLFVTFDLFAQFRTHHQSDTCTLFTYPRKAEAILQSLENNGFPFASVRLETTNPAQGDMTLRIIVDTNTFVSFDSIVLKGDTKLSKGFLYPYLGLRRGMAYCEKLMHAVDAKLTELPYATVAQPSGIEFIKNKAYLYIYLNERKVNQFDGYLGLVPVDERSGKISVNGELTLALQNLFKIGEQLNLHWYSSERHSQHLLISARFPYLFRTRFGLNGQFQLDKQDTSYLTLNYHVGIPYSFHSNNYVEPFFTFSSSSLFNPELLDLSSDTTAIDYRKSLWGLSTRLRKLDYIFNPHKGVDFSASLSVGQRIIRPNSRVDASLYDGLEMSRVAWRLEGTFVGYIPIRQWLVVVPRIQAGSLLSGPHYDNELFRIGGETGVRGFAINELRASTYLIYSAELRFLFAKNSYVNIFFDGGTYEQQYNGRYLKDTPMGFGAGVHLAVKSGIFYLEYALGRQLGNPISFKSGKIHLGVKVSF